MRHFFASVIAGAYLVLCLVFTGMAIVAVFGFAHPAMDLFNHIQPILLAGLFLLLVLAPVFLASGPLRALVFSLAATGIVASSAIYVPEFVRGLESRAPYPADERPVYTLMTFNVFGRNETPAQLVENILAVDPDVLALQEYSREVRSEIHRDLAAIFPHFQYCTGGQRAFVGLYSKLPFEPLNEDACSASAISTDRTARIIVRFDIEDAPDFSFATTHNDWPAPITRQAEQFGALETALSTVEPPLILVGDFNSTSWSYALRTFVERAGLTRHTHNIPTFPTLWYYLGDWRPTIPILPIDHVMTRGEIAIHDISTGEPSGSDHLPVIVRFSVSPAEDLSR